MSGKPPTKPTDRQAFKKAQVRWADLQARPGPPRLGDPGEPNSVLQALSKATAEAAAAQPPPAQFLIALMDQAEKVGVKMPENLESCKDYAGDLIEELKKEQLLTQVRLSLPVTACHCLTCR